MRNFFSIKNFAHLWKTYTGMILTVGIGVVSLIFWGISRAGDAQQWVILYRVLIAALCIYTAAVVMRNIMISLANGNVGTDMLVIIALISTLATGQFFASWILCVMVYTGNVIETYAEHRAKNSISALVDAAPATANVVIDPVTDPNAALSARWQTRDVATVKVGDVIIVRPGETVPTDGQLLTASAELNVSMINGESLPQQAIQGDKLLSGSINGGTSLVMRVTAPSRDSQYQKIIDLVASAQSSKAPVVRLADRIAVPFTIVSLLIGIIAWIATKDPMRFTQVMVLATPCPLLIAAPVAFMGGTNQLAKAHIIIKNQSVIESLTRVTHMFFDKTGTLTTTQPQVTRVELLPSWQHPQNLDSSWIIRAAGSMESYSMHILAQGITAAGRKEDARLGQGRLQVSDVREESGQGLEAVVEGYRVQVGRLGFVTGEKTQSGQEVSQELGQEANQESNQGRGETESTSQPIDAFSPLQADEMATYVAIDGQLAARLTLRDIPRPNARQVVEQFRAEGVKHITMLTGDRPESTAVIAQEVGIDDVRAGLLPEDKYNAVKFAQRFDNEKHVTTLMVGDGVNDTPVLAAADVSVAMTDGSSTAAAQVAQVVIMNDDLSSIAQAIAISQRTVRIMIQAVVGGLAAALIFMVVASLGFVPTVLGAFIQELIDASSILWALRAAFNPSRKKVVPQQTKTIRA